MAVALLDGAFAALADGTRRAFVARLLHGEATVTALAEAGHRRMSLPAALKHVRVLEAAGLAATRKAGRQRLVALRPEAFAAVLDFVEAYRIAALPRFDAAAGYIDLSDMDVT